MSGRPANHLQIRGQPAVECWQPFLGLARRSEAPRLSLPDGLLPWHYSDPQHWKQRDQGVAVCFGVLLSPWPSHAAVNRLGLT